MECYNFCRYQRSREYNDKFRLRFQRQLHVTKNLINRLGLEAELDGHNGCVNCLEWNTRGDLLASGSDDQNIVLWDPLLQKDITTLQSGHYGNIFSVKFLPNSNDHKLVSGAADFKVKVHDLSTKENIMCCSCHGGRVKRVCVAPNELFMFWSAAEDGVIIQYDLRIPHYCSNVCNNVLINLTHHLGKIAEAKCVTINPLKPHLLAVGANDPFVRLYDRRMIKTTSATYFRDQFPGPARLNTNMDSILEAGENNLPPGCVSYFVAGHLPLKQGEYLHRFRTLSVTYLAFSPDGNELLANLGGEQIYLFSLQSKQKQLLFDNINFANESSHFVEKNSTGSCFSNRSAKGICNGLTNIGISHGNDFSTCSGLCHKASCHLKQPAKYFDLNKRAKDACENLEFTTAIGLYSEAIALFPDIASLYGNRATAYCCRAWESDLYAALRDSYHATKLDPMYLKAHFRLAYCLFKLEWIKEAMECLTTIRLKFPDFVKSKQFSSLENDIQVEWFAKMEQERESSCKEFKSSSPHCSPIKRSMSRYLNYLTDQERLWRESAFDYDSRFCGHCNITTDIKEANFFGSNGQYVVAGSDDGSIFIWDRVTANISRVLRGDDSIVNCIQPHPTSCILATSGIDHVVRIWGPKAEDGSQDLREVHDLELATSANQRRMDADPLEIMLLNMGYTVPSSHLDHHEFDEDVDEDFHHVIECTTS